MGRLANGRDGILHAIIVALSDSINMAAIFYS
jgi:hypothetical protein